MAAVEESIHFDRGQVFKWEETPEGYLRVHMRIARTGELKYYNKDGSERIEVVSPEVLFDPKSTDSFKNKYITHPTHPPEMLTDQNDERLSSFKRGMTGTLITKEITTDGDFLGIVGTITHPQAKRDVIEGNTREVSCGYLAGTRLRADGKFVQEYRLGNHITLCPQGRAGSEVGVSMDSAEDEPKEVFISEPIHNDSSEIMTTSINSVVDTISLKVDEFQSIDVPVAYAKEISDRFKRDADAVGAAKAHIAKLEDELKTAKAEFAEMKQGKTDYAQQINQFNDALLAAGYQHGADQLALLAKEKDIQTARADQLQEEVNSLKSASESRIDSAELMNLVKARRELERKCDGLLPKDFNVDEANDRQLREAVILNKSSLTTLEGRNDAYIEARFDAILEAHENRDTSAPLAASARQAASTPQQPEVRADVLEWQNMIASMTNRNPATTAK